MYNIVKLKDIFKNKFNLASLYFIFDSHAILV